MLLREGKTHLFTRPADDVYSSSVVYISDDFALARSYVALFPNVPGDVYEVTPSPTSSLRVDHEVTS